MDDEIEDIVGEVQLTDSQKSLATTNAYSQDFTDSSSEKNNSSGKDTYVIEYDSDDSDGIYQLHNKQSVINLNNSPSKTKELNTNKLSKTKVNSNDKVTVETKVTNTQVHCEQSLKTTATSVHTCYVVAQETFTQTSKTIFELAQTDGVQRTADYKAIETQTSSISVVEDKTVEYRIKVSGSRTKFSRNEISNNSKHKLKNASLQNESSGSSYCQNVEPLNLTLTSEEDEQSMDNFNDVNSYDILKVIDERTEDGIKVQKEIFDNTSEFEDTSKFDSDFDADSLVDEYRDTRPDNQDDISVTSVPKSVDNDVEELYNNLEKSLDLRTFERPENFDITRHITLTPLTEESVAVRVDSVLAIPPTKTSISRPEETRSANVISTKKTEVKTKFQSEPTDEMDQNLIFTNNSGVKVKMLPQEESKTDAFKLPPIHNQSCPSSPHLNYLFGKSGALPGLFESQRMGDRWELETKDLASGESAQINGRVGNPAEPVVLRANEQCHLPSIYIESHINYGDSNTIDSSRNPKSSMMSSDTPRETISIQERIKELKMSKERRQRMPKCSSTTPESRSVSPGSASLDEGRPGDAAERGCEMLCLTVIKKLRTQSWFEVVEILEELPKMLEKFWCVITEQRIADLVRQVSVHVDSPRTQVARVACNTLATILKNTNYTKKPDFYEAVTSLLVKTGSFSKPVRRAANVALDDIVCGVELSHSVTVLCVHGVSHKSALVRCAAARLLVVCAALAGGGRDLLRARPPTAAAARRHALRALAALLDDKSIDTRKYAERLYSMLRPLANFEAYYLTDVEVELASKQMKKYDQLLLCGPPKETR